MNPKFTAQHYNALAKEIREIMVSPDRIREPTKDRNLAWNAALTTLALNLAIRFEAERADYKGYKFDPLKFLDACSPDPERMPLSELWDEQ